MSDCKVRKVTCDFVFLRERPNVCIAVFRLVHTGTIIARVYRRHLMPCDQTKGANVSVHTDAQNGVFLTPMAWFLVCRVALKTGRPMRLLILFTCLDLPKLQ